MKAELNINTDELRQQITEDVIMALKPLLNGKGADDDTLLDKKGLAKYLNMSESWVSEQTRLRKLPFFKVGGDNRYRKRDIDRWLDSHKSLPVTSLPTGAKIVKSIYGRG